jgi:cell division protein FtsL
VILSGFPFVLFIARRGVKDIYSWEEGNMASNSCTFIIVPDATSQCRRYTIAKSLLWTIGIFGTVVLIAVVGALSLIFNEYKAMSLKSARLEKLKKVASSQRNTIDRYEQDITQLSKHLTNIKQLNSRLMVLTGLDPAKSSDTAVGVGGFEETESELKTQE